jgi:hypothetical protein
VANIPLYRYGEIEFPLTPKSTLNFWAVQGFYHEKGPFSNTVTKIVHQDRALRRDRRENNR